MATESPKGESIIYEDKQRRFDQFWPRMTELRRSGGLCFLQWLVHKVVLVLSSLFQAILNRDSIIYENKERRFDQFWSRIVELRQSGGFCDVYLKVDKVQWLVHKVVLVTLSPYFHAMFSQDMKEKNQNVIEIHGLDVESVDKIIEYAYTGVIQINCLNVQGLLIAADMWGLEDLKDRCALFMSEILEPSKCLEFISIAESHSCPLLLSKSRAFSVANYSEVSKSEDFINLGFDQLSRLIDNLKTESASSALQVYQSIMRWTKHNLHRRQSHLIDLLKYVKFDSMTKEEFKEITGEKLFRSSIELRDLFSVILSDRLTALEDRMERSKAELKTYIYFYTDDGRSLIYDPSTKMLAELSKEFKGFWTCSLVAVNQKIFVMMERVLFETSFAFEKFDPLENRWTTMTPVLSRKSRSAAGSLNGLVYVSGGANGEDSSSCDVECFNPGKNSWSSITPMNRPRAGHCLIALGNCLYAIGGHDGHNAVNEVERYDLQTGKWEDIESMKSGRCVFAAAVSRGKLYVAGGGDEEERPCRKDVECYDPTTGSWQLVASFKHERLWCSLVDVDGFLYLFGGREATAERYDPVTNTWREHDTWDKLCLCSYSVAFECDKLSESIDFRPRS